MQIKNVFTTNYLVAHSGAWIAIRDLIVIIIIIIIIIISRIYSWYKVFYVRSERVNKKINANFQNLY